MDITLEQYETIQFYLDGKMEAPEANAFLQQLETNMELKESYEFERSLRQNLASISETREMLALASQHDEPTGDPADRAFIRNIIQQSAKEWKEGKAAPPKPASPKVVPFRRWATIAVAATLLIAVAGIFFFQHYGHHTEDPAQLFAAFFKKDTIPNEKYPMLAQAFTEYRNNNYKTLQNYDLDNLPTLKGGDDQRQKILELGYYYRGISFLVTDAPAKAMPDLQWVIDHATTEDLVWKAQWYEALAMIRSSRIPAAIVLLRSVSANPKAEGYNRQATDLLHQLSKISP